MVSDSIANFLNKIVKQNNKLYQSHPNFFKYGKRTRIIKLNPSQHVVERNANASNQIRF